VRLAYQTFRSVQLVHFYQIVSRSTEILPDVAFASRGFEKKRSSLENPQYVQIHFLIVTRQALELAVLANFLAELFALLTHDLRFQGGSMQDCESPMAAGDGALCQHYIRYVGFPTLDYSIQSGGTIRVDSCRATTSLPASL
jgi:hypothetical protein